MDAYDDMAEAAKRLYKPPPSRAKQMLAKLEAHDREAAEEEMQANLQLQHVLKQRLRMEGARWVLGELVKEEG